MRTEVLYTVVAYMYFIWYTGIDDRMRKLVCTYCRYDLMRVLKP